MTVGELMQQLKLCEETDLVVTDDGYETWPIGDAVTEVLLTVAGEDCHCVRLCRSKWPS